MTGVYIHVPFCYRKCTYCNFLILPLEKIWEDSSKSNLYLKKNTLIQKYLKTLQQQIFDSKNILSQGIKTIYFGGGTPSLLEFEDFEKIIDSLLKIDDKNLLELGIEINPDPFEKTMNLIEKICEKYKNLKKIRISIGIQSLDDEILKATGRNYDYEGLEKYLQKIFELKKSNKNLFINLDFMSFGTSENLQNFEKIISQADSLSLYTLELFSGSAWHKDIQKRKKIKIISEEKIYSQFEKLKKIIEKNGFSRYEISNRKKNTDSTHNQIYWNMENYLGLGPGAHSYQRNENIFENFEQKNNDFSELNRSSKNFGTRFAVSSDIKKYLEGVVQLDKKETFELSENDYLFEKFFLALRTEKGVFLQDFEKILIPNYKVKIKDLEEQKFLKLENGVLKLCEKGFRFYNTIITDLID